MRYIAKFSQLKGDAEQCLVNLTDNPAPSPRKLTGKAGRLPGCPVRDKARAAHLVSDVGLAAQAVGRVRAAHLVSDAGLAVPGMAGAGTAGKVNTGAHPGNFWRCVLRPRREPGPSR